MVKFSLLALAAAITTASASNSAAAPTLNKKTIKLGNRKLRRGDATTEALLKKAVPYKKNGARRLEEDNQFEITSAHAIEFSQCIDVVTKDEDMFDEDIVQYVESGAIIAAKSYVTFHVCKKDSTCYLDSQDDLFIIDLPSYVTAVAAHYANEKQDYCNSCEELDEYCNPEEEEEEAQEDAEQDEGEDEGEDGEEENDEEGEGEEQEGEEGDEEGRKLKKTVKKLSRKSINRILANNNGKELIDCDQCQSYGCYEDEEEEDENANGNAQNQKELDENIANWIEELAQCQETGIQWNGLDLYTGVMCSTYGDGVELAVFANEDCTWYAKEKQFVDVYQKEADDNGNVWDYASYAEGFIKSAFSEVTPCERKEYYNPNEDNDNEDEDEEQNYEASEYCQNLMEQEMVSLNNCEAEEEQEEEEEDEDQDYDSSWYNYDMKEADEVNQVCNYINTLDAADYHHVYDDNKESGSGSWYERNKKGQIITAGESQGMSTGAITAIVIFVLAVVGGAGFVLMKKNSKKSETDYQGGEMS